MSYNSQSESTNNYRPQYFSHLAITRRIRLKLKYIRPEYLFEQYYLFLVKPEDLGETKYIKKNKRKESIENLYKNLEKLKSDLKAELFELALRYESKNNETLNIHNSQPEKEKQERLQNSYIKFLEELYEKQVGIWIANQYTIVETYKELEKYHEQYWEREPISRINQNKDFYSKLNGPGGKADHEKNENIDVCVIRECFEEAEIVLRNEKLLKIFEETCYSTKEWRAEPCLQKEAKYILVPILEENIELIDGKIKAYEQDVLDLLINAQKLEEIKIKVEKQPQRTQETFNFLNDIELEIPEEEIPEIVDEQFPVLALNFGKLSSFEIQTLIKYKKKIQESIRPLRRIEHKIQTIKKSYKGFKYLAIFDKIERKIIAQKFGENPTITELSKDNTILYKFQNTIFEFEIHKSSTNKLTYLKLRLSKDQTQINGTTNGKQTWEFFHKNYSKLPLI
ncbi:hypothetical protein C2G38_2210287 [Gigaspora rosea]|uniref:Nudix hydrolase domain-containing protein n=1 Tax=Gigaspora rosea TaxID=44941 RepID=A0A397UH73_9GLOM|nr:hypothetical protein C2G38_2210287 [Gigaspora rosea]